MLSVAFLCCCAECRYTECRCTDCHSAMKKRRERRKRKTFIKSEKNIDELKMKKKGRKDGDKRYKSPKVNSINRFWL